MPPPLPPAALPLALLALLMLSSYVRGSDVAGCPCFSRCQEGATYKVEGDTACYRMHYDALSWTAASTACSEDGGRLIDFATESRKIFVESVMLSSITSDFWAAGRYDTTQSKWLWSDPNTTPILDSMWAAPSPPAGDTSNPTCSYIPSSPSQTVALYSHRCTAEMGFICYKQRVLFDTSTLLLSAASVQSGSAVTVDLRGSGFPGDVFVSLSQGGCSEAGSASKSQQFVNPANTSYMAYTFDPAHLQVSSDYDICWGLPSSGGSPGSPTPPQRIAVSSVRVKVAGYATLNSRTLVLQVTSLGLPVVLEGVDISADLWLAPFASSDCSGAMPAPPSLLAPVPGSGGTRGTFTPDTDPTAAGGPAMRLCIAASRDIPPASAFFPTQVTLRVVGLPALTKAFIELTYVEGLAPHTLVLQGSNMQQPGEWSTGFFGNPLCLGTPAVSPTRMDGCAEQSCGFTLPAGLPPNTPLHACLIVGSSTTKLSTNVSLIAKERPAFKRKTEEEVGLSFAEASSGASRITIEALNLATSGRTDPMLYAGFVPSPGTCETLLKGVSPGDGSPASSATFGPLLNVNAVSAEAAVPPSLRGVVSVCVVAASSLPSTPEGCAAAFNAMVVLNISHPPEFDGASGGGLTRLVPYSDYLLGNPVEVAGRHFSSRHLWILLFAVQDLPGSDASSACSNATSSGGGTAMPAATPKILRIPSSFVVESIPPGVGSAAPSRLALCWTASTTPPGEAAVWEASGVFLESLPPPELRVPSEPEGVLLSAFEASSTTPESKAKRVVGVRGTYLQDGVIWMCSTYTDPGSSEVPISQLRGASCIASAVQCQSPGGAPSAGWCAQASFEIPPVSPEDLAGGGGGSGSAISIRSVVAWSLGAAAPTSITPSAEDSMTRITVARPVEVIPQDIHLSLGQARSGFAFNISGASLGLGAFVWLHLREGSGAAEEACVYPAGPAGAKGSPSEVFPLPGEKTSASAEVSFPPAFPGLPQESVSQLCIASGWGGHAASPNTIPPGERGAATASGVVLHVAGPPVFRHAILTPTLPEISSESGIRLGVSGVNLMQSDLWGVLCKPDCATGCISNPFPIENSTFQVPRPGVSGWGRLGFSPYTASLCWMAISMPNPGDLPDLSAGGFTPSSVQVALPGIPTFPPAGGGGGPASPIPFRASQERVFLPEAVLPRGGSDGTAELPIPGTYLSFCGEGMQWSPAVNATSSGSPGRIGIYFTQGVGGGSLPEIGASKEICVAFSPGGSPVFPTGVHATRVGAPAVPPAPTGAHHTISLSLLETAVGSTEISLYGDNLGEGDLRVGFATHPTATPSPLSPDEIRQRCQSSATSFGWGPLVPPGGSGGPHRFAMNLLSSGGSEVSYFLCWAFADPSTGGGQVWGTAATLNTTVVAAEMPGFLQGTRGVTVSDLASPGDASHSYPIAFPAEPAAAAARSSDPLAGEAAAAPPPPPPPSSTGDPSAASIWLTLHEAPLGGGGPPYPDCSEGSLAAPGSSSPSGGSGRIPSSPLLSGTSPPTPIRSAAGLRGGVEVGDAAAAAADSAASGVPATASFPKASLQSVSQRDLWVCWGMAPPSGSASAPGMPGHPATPALLHPTGVNVTVAGLPSAGPLLTGSPGDGVFSFSLLQVAMGVASLRISGENLFGDAAVFFTSSYVAGVGGSAEGDTLPSFARPMPLGGEHLGAFTVALPWELATPVTAGVSLHLTVVPPGGSRNATPLVPIGGVSISFNALPTVTPVSVAGFPGKGVAVAGEQLAPSSGTPGIQVAFAEAESGCAGLAWLPSARVNVMTPGGVEVAVPDFGLPDASLLRLCMALQNTSLTGGGVARFTRFFPAPVVVAVRAATAAPETPHPPTPPPGGTAAPPTPAPPTPPPAPPTPAPETPSPTQPCPDASAMGAAVRDACFFGVPGGDAPPGGSQGSFTAVIPCMSPASDPALGAVEGAAPLSSSAPSCGGEYLRCAASTEGAAAPCFANPDRSGAAGLEIYFPEMPPSGFDASIFIAGAAAAAAVPPEYIGFLGYSGEGVSRREAVVASGAAPTRAAFSLLGGAAAVQRLNTSVQSDIFGAIGAAWRGATLLRPGDTPPPAGTASGSPATPSPSVALPDDSGGGGGGPSPLVIAVVVGVCLVLCALLLLLLLRKLRRHIRGGGGGGGIPEGSEASPPSDTTGTTSVGGSSSLRFSSRPGGSSHAEVSGPCGLPLSDCQCGSGACQCDACVTSQMRFAGSSAVSGSRTPGGSESGGLAASGRPPAVPTPGGAASQQGVVCATPAGTVSLGGRSGSEARGGRATSQPREMVWQQMEGQHHHHHHHPLTAGASSRSSPSYTYASYGMSGVGGVSGVGGGGGGVGGGPLESSAELVPETISRHPLAGRRREWDAGTPAGQVGGGGGGVGSAGSGVSPSGTTGSQQSLRRWMLPSGGSRASEAGGGGSGGPACHICRNLWEGGRFCGYCGAPHEDIVEVIKHERPEAP